VSEITEIDVRKTLCCPGGCSRQGDECFVDGHRHRFTPNSREREQAKAILARFHLTRRSCDFVGSPKQP
jgi:hypothetical protein